jgi:hypothetical protein
MFTLILKLIKKKYLNIFLIQKLVLYLQYDLKKKYYEQRRNTTKSITGWKTIRFR